MKYTTVINDEGDFKIVTTARTIGTEDRDREWVATVYDSEVARHIQALLERHPHDGVAEVGLNLLKTLAELRGKLIEAGFARGGGLIALVDTAISEATPTEK